MRPIARPFARLLLLLALAPLPVFAQSLPTPQTQGGVTFVSGGIAEDEQQAMEAMRGQYNLRLLFAQEGTGGYFAEVRVRITDSAGATLVDTLSHGPFFFARLAPGRYTIAAVHNGKPMTRAAEVPASGGVDVNIYWAGN
jgi:hypothetical protein